MRSFTKLFSAFVMILLAFSVRIGQQSFRLGGVIDSSQQQSVKTKYSGSGRVCFVYFPGHVLAWQRSVHTPIE